MVAESALVREIAYSPLPSQSRFHDCRSRFKLFSGAVGSGKSAALVQEAIRLSVVNAGRLGLIGAPTYRILHDTTQREFFRVLDENHIPYQFNKSEKEVQFLDLGSRVIFRTLDDPERLVGTNLAWFGIDEAGYAHEGSFLRLMARLRDPLATELCGFGATTPNGKNWLYDRFFGEKKNDSFQAIKAIPGENIYLPSDFYDSLAKSYDPRFYRQEVLGEYLSLQSGTVYHAFERERNVNPAIEYDPASQLCWSLDWNVDPACSVIAQIKDYAPQPWMSSQSTKTIEVLDEIAVRDADNYLVCDQFVEKTQKYLRNGRRLRVQVTGDASGSNRNRAGTTDWQMIKEYFSHKPEYEMVYKVQSSNPAVKDRVNAVNAALHNSVGETRLTVHPRCSMLIKDLERVLWQKDSHGNPVGQISQADKMLSHSSDALGYLVESEFSLTRTTGGYKTGRLV